MKKFFTLRSPFSLFVGTLTLFLGLLSPNVQAAVIFTENMGTGTAGTTSIASSTFQHSGTYTYSGTGDTRTTTPSTIYPGASGGRNVFLTTSSLPRTFQMDGIVTTGYTAISLSFGAHKAALASDMTALVVEYSTDGTTWTPLTFPAQPTGSGTVAWRLITITGGTIPAASNLRLRWSNTTSQDTYRIDDINLSGTIASGPTLSASALVAFGAQCPNEGPYGPNSFTITGSSLTTADVTVGALSGYTYSTTSGGTYTPTLSLSQPGGAYSQTIFVQFDPTAVASYDGNIAVGGGGATGINVAASGSGVDTPPTVATGAASAITSSSATVAGTLNTASSCGAMTAYGIEYSTTPGFANGTGTPVASTNLSGTAFSSALSGLAPCTIYYTHAYATRASGTTYGAQGTFTTAVIAAPVATAGTSIGDLGFTANWDAVTGATGYQLDVGTSPTFGSAGGQLVGWDFADGNTTADSGIPANAAQAISTNATGTIDYTGGVILNDGWDNGNNSKYWQIEVVTTGYAGLTLSSVQRSSNTGPKEFKVQYRIGAGGVWTDVSGGGVTVANNITTGVLSGLALPVACENEASVFLRWIMASNTSVNNGTVANTGTSRIDDISVDAVGAPSFVTGYDNLSVAGTSQAVTGLDPLTTYYYRVRTVGASCTSGNSNVITVNTTAGVSPLLTAGGPIDFGTLCINTDGGPQSFTVGGNNLTTADVTVAALAGFSFSTTELGTYTTSLSLTQPGGSFSQDIWVKFTPTAAQNYDGDITVGGGGAADASVAMTGSGVDTDPVLTTGAASAITTFSATVAGQITDAGCGTITAYGIEYSTTMGFTPGTGSQVASTNLSGGAFSSDLAGLTPCTPYYYVAYATRASGTTYGAEQSFTTATISAPVASAGTAVGTNGFTANWGTVSGATDYRLDVYTQTTSLATDLFISEYVEGSGNNRYIEIFNGTGASVNLSNYELRLFSNGSASPTTTNALSGTLAVNATRVYRSSSATIYGGTSTSSTAVNFNGNDAFALYKVSTSSYVDIIGEIGNDPGSAWTGGGLSTVDRTLVRKAGVSGGVTTNPTGLGFPTLASEWDGYPEDDISHLGSHTFNSLTQTFVPGYNDLSVTGLSEVVSGLDPNTTYYYQVRAVSGSCTSASSDEIEVTTTGFGCTDPLASNYDAGAAPDNSTCTYCTATFTYNTPTPTPITIGSGIPDQNMAVAADCHDFKIAMNAYERFVGAIVPVGNVYTTTTGNSPTAQGNPTPDPNNARWNFLVSVDLGTYDFTQVAVYMDMDFDPGATPVYQTVDISALAVAQGQGASHIQQQAQNMQSAFWALLFPGVSFDATVPGTYDLRVRVVSPTTGAELISHDIQVVVEGPGCTDPLADNYDAGASTDDGSCTYCTPTYTTNAPTPTPITIGSGIPDQNMAVSQDCRGIDVAMSAYARYVGAIIPAGNVYTTTVGNSPTSGSDPTPDPTKARWNLLGSVDLGSFDFTDVNVFLDLDFDPGATPVWNTVNLSQQMIANSMGNLHVYQASENLADGFWTIAFPGVTFDPQVPGIYDVRVRLESVYSGEELVNMAIQVVVEGPGCTDPLADNYDAGASTDDGSCTYCTPTYTTNAPTPTPITIGSGIPDQNMAVSQDCRGIDVAMSAYARYVGAIIPAGNVYTTTTGHSPVSGSDPTPDPVNARWNILGSVDLGTYDFTDVNVFLDLDFDPGATPVWNTLNLSQSMIDNSMGGLHVYQAAENLASGYWTIAFPGVTPVDPDVPGIYDIRVRLESAYSGEELVNMAIQVVVEAPEITWYSQATGNVNDPIWDVVPVGTAGAATFGTNANMVVQNGHTVTNTADVDVKNLDVQTGGTLALGAATTITVNGDEATFGGAVTAANASTLKLAGTETTILESSGGPLNLWNLTVNTALGTITDAAINIRGTLQLDGGNFDADLANVTLASTASGTGRLGTLASGASYTGNITVQRFIPAGHTNWRMLASPVTGRTVNDWKDDFITAGFPGSHYPNFQSPVGSGIPWPSVRWYNESLDSNQSNDGVTGVTSNTQPLTPGQGFMAWSGDNLTTTQAFTVDLTGAPVIAQSPITLPMSFTSSGTLEADGWNLVANPLPSPISFSAMDRGADVQNAYWIFDPVAGNNKSWVNGVGQGGLNGIIQSSQGFFVKADGTNFTTTVDETAKVNQSGGGTFGGDQNTVLPILNLSIASGVNTYSDEATVVFAQGSPAYDGIDALKMTFKTIGAPQIGVLSNDGHQLAVDFFGNYSTAVQIPLKVDVDVTGTYTISAAMAGITNLSCLSLTDLQTGTVTPLSDGASYSFAINADDDANALRFVINGTVPLPFYNEAALCHGQEGRATVVVNDGPVDITWTNVFGNVLLHQTNVADGIAVFDGLAGDYQVHITPVGACGTLAADFTITAPEAIGADLMQTATSCPNSADGSVGIAVVTGGTAPYSFLWSNGAITNSITGAAGNYTGTITDAAGCTSSVDATIPAGEGAIAQFSTSGGILVTNTPVQFTNSSVLADSYVWDFGDGTTSTEFAPEHSYTLPGTYTVTLTATGGDCTGSSTLVLTVEASTGISNEGGSQPLAVWATPDQIVIRHNFANAPVDVAVFDATGRLALSRMQVVKPERITLSDRSLNTGVWFVRITSGDVQRTFRVPLVR